MSLSGSITRLQALALLVSGIKAAPAKPPEGAGQFPFAVAYPRSGPVEFKSAGWAEMMHTVYVEFHVSRSILPLAVNQAIGFVEAYPTLLLADPTLNGNCASLNAVRYTFGRLEWGGLETLGVRFEVDLKVNLVST